MTGNGRVSTDQKIGQERPARPASPAIEKKRLAGKERSFIWDGLSREPVRGQRLIDVLDTRDSNRNLRIDDRVDDQPLNISRPLQCV